MALALSEGLFTRVKKTIACLCKSSEPAISFLLRGRERLCQVFPQLKFNLTSQRLQTVVSVNSTPVLYVMAESLLVDKRSYREDQAVMSLVQLMKDKYKSL